MTSNCLTSFPFWLVKLILSSNPVCVVSLLHVEEKITWWQYQNWWDGLRNKTPNYVLPWSLMIYIVLALRRRLSPIYANQNVGSLLWFQREKIMNQVRQLVSFRRNRWRARATWRHCQKIRTNQQQRRPRGYYHKYFRFSNWERAPPGPQLPYRCTPFYINKSQLRWKYTGPAGTGREFLLQTTRVVN